MVHPSDRPCNSAGFRASSLPADSPIRRFPRDVTPSEKKSFPMQKNARCLTFAVILGVGMTLFGLPQAASVAQDDALGTAFLPAPRTFRQHLSRAVKAIEEKRYGDAVTSLGSLLAEQQEADAILADVTQDFFIGPFAGSIVRSSLKTEAQNLLGQLPQAGRELYELQFGAEAKALLETAVADGDMVKLAEVTRKYFHTAAGYEASLLLGRIQLDRGQPLAAAMCFERLLRAPAAARRFEPELSLLLAACWTGADRPTQALATLDGVRVKFPKIDIQLGGQRITALPSSEEAPAWLASKFGGGRSQQSGFAREWLIFRGNAARNGDSPGDMPLPTFRWRVPTASDPTDESLIEELRVDKAEQRVAALPSLHPLAVSNLVLMRTPERLLAIDFQTGKRVWVYPWWNASYEDVSLTNQPSSGADELGVRREKLFQRLWQDVPYGQVSSDGKSVFMLDNLRYASMMGGAFMPAQGGIRFRNPDAPATFNQLVALDLSRQGSLRWMIGGDTGLDEPKLAGAFFLGVPLPLSGQLFVLAELHGEIRLVSLDPHTGKQEWSQQLAHVDSYTIQHDVTRRLAGATPSYADGVLICPTSAGAVVAVDLATRSLLWGYQYEQPKPNNAFGLGRPFMTRPDLSASRWMDSSVTISKGAVLLTPIDDGKLVCLDLDLAPGRPRWTASRQDQLADALYVGCIHGDKALVICKHRIVALDMKNGQPVWQEPLALQLDQGEMPSGRGFPSGNFYFLPTTTSHLLKISIDDGVIVERTRTPHPLGNLISYQNEVISHSAGAVAAYYQIEPLRQLVAQRLQKAGDDAWAIARQGELLLHDGKISEAVASLQRAHELDPEDNDVRGLLVSTFLTALQQDFTAHRELAPRIQPLIDLPSQLAEYWRVTAHGLHEAGELKDAVDAYIALSDTHVSSRNGEEASEPWMVEQSPGWSVRMERWIQARLAQLYDQGDPAVVARLDAWIAERVATADTRSLIELARDVEHYSFHANNALLRLALADQLLQANRLLEAEWLLVPLRDSGDEAIRGKATARLSVIYTQSGELELAARLYRELGSHWAEQVCYLEKTGSELLADARANPTLKEGFDDSATWPWGHVRADEQSGQNTSESLSRLITLPVYSSRNLPRAPLTFGFDTRFNSIVGRNSNGQKILEVTLERVQQNGLDQVHLLGHLGVAYFGADLLGIDLLKNSRSSNEPVRWRIPVTSQTQELQRERPVRPPFDPTAKPVRSNLDSSGRAISSLGPVNQHGIFYQRSRTLMCVDPLSGQLVWSQSGLEAGSTIVGDTEFVLVVSPNADTAQVYRAADGKLLGQRHLPAVANRWTFASRNVLAWDTNGERSRLYLRDIWEERDIWSEEVSQGAKGTLIGGSELALLDVNGRFVIRSLTGEQVIVRTRLEAEEHLQSIQVLLSGDQYFVVANTDVTRLTTTEGRVRTVAPFNAPLVTGRMYAFDRKTGQKAWPLPAFVQEHGFVINQPANSPALWFVRSKSSEQAIRSSQNSDQASILCIDRRNGRILLEKDHIPTQANEFNIVSDPVAKTSSLSLPGRTFTLTFTDAPIPPEPPAQTGSASSLSARSSLLKSLVRSFVRVWQRETDPAEVDLFGDIPAE